MVRKLVITMTMCHHCPLLRVVEGGNPKVETWVWACGWDDKMRKIEDAEFTPEWCPIPEGGVKKREGKA